MHDADLAFVSLYLSLSLYSTLLSLSRPDLATHAYVYRRVYVSVYVYVCVRARENTGDENEENRITNDD